MANDCPQCGELQRALTLQTETAQALTAQVMRLGQCVVCGELDEQDGTRRGGEFRCAGCVCKGQEPSDG